MAVHQHEQIVRLERNLLAAAKSKGPFDPSVRRLRTSIRDSYEALILHDHTLSESLEVEQSLWRLHYREIEGFRVRIRKLLAVEAVPRDVALERGKRRKKGNRQEPLLRTLTAFKSFLGEASGFFHGLLIKLRLKYGLTSSFDSKDKLASEGLRDELRSCMVSCHRLLIYLGDLARYKELYAVIDVNARDWSVSANYYRQAALLWPASGNPHNQLAVLCTYSGDELMALYHYCRSVAVDVPFVTAWDNVALLFEKNKQHIAQASSLPSEFGQSGSLGNGVGIQGSHELSNREPLVVEQDSWIIDKVEGLRRQFVMYFIKLVGILLTQSSTDELEEVLDATERALRQLSYAGFEVALETKKSCELGAPPVLQIMAILVFCIHHISSKMSTADVSSRKNSELFLRSALKFALNFCSLSVEEAKTAEICSVFPYAVIFMEWLASHSDILGTVEGEKGIAIIFAEFRQKVVAFDSIWIKKGIVAGDLREERDVLRANVMDIASESSDKAQWEDHELLGFIPLASIHMNLDFSKQLAGGGTCDLPTYLFWKLRCMEALKKLSHTLKCETPCQLENTSSYNATGIKEDRFLRRASDLDHSKETVNGVGESAIGINPTPSLKEWIKQTVISTTAPATSAHVERPKTRQFGTDVTVHDLAYPTSKQSPPTSKGCADVPSHSGGVKESSQIVSWPAVGDIAPGFIVSTTAPVLEQVNCHTNHQTSLLGENLAPLTCQVKMNVVSLSEDKGTMAAGLTGMNTRVGQSVRASELLVNASRKAGCGFPTSSIPLRTHDNSEENNIPKEIKNISGSVEPVEDMRSVALRTYDKNTGSNILKKNKLVSPVFQEQAVEDMSWFDYYTHVKPARSREAAGSLEPKYPSGLTFKNKVAALANTKRFHSFSKMFFWSNKCYESQNPFVLWTKKSVNG